MWMTLMLHRIVHNGAAFIGHGEVLHINASPAVSFVMIMMGSGPGGGGEGSAGGLCRSALMETLPALSNQCDKVRTPIR